MDNLLYFIWGFLAFQIVGTLLELAFYQGGLTSTIDYETAGMFLAYAFMVLGFVLYIFLRNREALFDVFRGFARFRDLLIGLFIFMVTSLIGSIYSNILENTVSWFADNANQESVISMVETFPLASFFMIVLFAPFSEELTYRVGLNGAFGRKRRWIGILVSVLVFALAHFDFTSIETAMAGDPLALYRELLNLPVYLLAALGLCLAYLATGNVAASMNAHMINNLISFVSILV